MANFATLYASFYDSDHNQITSPVSYLTPIRARGTAKANKVGRGSATFRLDANTLSLVKIGNVCSVYVHDALIPGDLTVAIFKIEKIRVKIDNLGILVIAEGYDELDELTGFSTFRNIGGGYSTTVYTALAIGENTLRVPKIGDLEGAVGYQTSHTGENHVKYQDPNPGFAVGDDIVIELNNGKSHTSVITSIGTVDGYPAFFLADNQTGEASVGNKLIKPEIFAGDDIGIYLNDGTTFWTNVNGNPGWRDIELENAAPVIANIGNAVNTISSLQATTDDLTQVASRIGDDWTIDIQNGNPGTVLGTGIEVDNVLGGNITQILQAIAKKSGEYYRIKRTNPYLPSRVVEWRTTYDDTGLTAQLSQTPQADYENVTKCVLLSFEDTHEQRVITHMTGKAADNSYSLGSCSDTTLSGNPNFSQYFDHELGAWIIEHTAVSGDHPRLHQTISSDIAPFTYSSDNITKAADEMQAEIIRIMESNAYLPSTYVATIVAHKNIYPGQAINIQYTAEDNYTVTDYLYINEVEHTVTAGGELGGIRVTKLTLSKNRLFTQANDNTVIAESIASGSSGVGSVSITGGSGSPGGSSHNPVTLGTIAPPNAVTISAEQVLGFSATSDGDTNPNTVLASDANGYLRLTRLGIGTPPNSHFHVVGLTTLDGDLIFAGDQGIFGTSKITIAPTGDLDLVPSGLVHANANLRFAPAKTIYNTAGDLTISAVDTLNFNAGIDIDLNPANNVLVNGILNVNTIRDLSGSNIVLQDDAGNVGVGINPTYKFHVSGSIGFNGDLTFVGNNIITTSNGGLTIASADELNIDPVSGNTWIDSDLEFTAGRKIKNVSGDLNIEPIGDLYLSPQGADTFLTATSRIGGSGYVSGFGGAQWRITTNDGFAEFQKIKAKEMHIQLFNADEMLVSRGSRLLTKYMGITPEDKGDFLVPDVGSTATLWVYDSEIVPNAPIFPNNGWVELQIADFSGGGARVQSVFGQVTNYSDGTGGDDGLQSWDFTTRKADGWDSSFIFSSESVVIGWGLSGDTFILTTVADLAGSPHQSFGMWQGENPYTPGNMSITTRVGNLTGIANTSHGETGIWAGISPHTQSAILSDRGIKLRNTTISMHGPGSGDTVSLRLYALQFTPEGEGVKYPDLDISQNLILRSSGSGSWESHIDNAPTSPGSNYIYNTIDTSGDIVFRCGDASNWSASDYVDIGCYVDVSGTILNDDVRIFIQFFQSDGTTELSDKVLLASSISSENEHYLRVPLRSGTWTNARCKLTWQHLKGSGQEVIRIDPTQEGPYLAIGKPSSIPTVYWSENTIGIWAGYDPSDTNFKMRIGGGSTNTSDPAVTINSGNGMAFWSATDKTTPTITFANNGEVYFSNVVTLGTSGEIRQGTGIWGTTFDGIRIYNASGIGTFSTYTNGNEIVRHDENGISIKAVDKFSAGSIDWFDYLGGNNKLSIGVDVDLGSIVGGYLETPSQLTLTASSFSFVYEPASSVILTLNNSSAWLNGGLLVGDYVTPSPSQGQLVLDQGAGDYPILEFGSSDVTHYEGGTIGVASDVYGAFRKASATDGGLYINGFTSGAYATWLAGWATNGNSITSTSALAPVVIQGYVGETNVGSGNNAVVMRSGQGTKWILKGNGDVYIDGTQNTYDHLESDIEAVRAISLLSKDVVKTTFDKFVRYNRKDLERENLVKGSFINTTAMMKLHSGAIWQMNLQNIQRDQIVEGLKQEIKTLKEEILCLLKN